MLYAFIAIAVILLISLLCYTIYNARKNSSEYLMNMILLSRYNRLLKVMGRKAKFDVSEFELKFENKDNITDDDILNNVEIIKNVDANFARLQNEKANKSYNLDKLNPIKIMVGCESVKLEQKKNKITQVLDYAKQIVIKKELSSDISKFFGNMEGYLLEGYLLFFLQSKVIIVELGDIFNIEVVDMKKVNIKVEKEIVHEVDYDGENPLEELDFRQEEIPNEHESQGFEILTKVKCNVYNLVLQVGARTLKTKLHLMRTEDIAKFEKLAGIENKKTFLK